MLLIWWSLLMPFIHCISLPSSNDNAKTSPQVQATSVSKVESPPEQRQARGSSFFNVRNLPEPTIIVRQNTFHPHEFRTIQAAVNSLKERTGPQVIYVHDGIYREQVYVDYGDPLIIRGRQPRDGEQNFASMIFNLGAKEAKSNQASATLNVVKDDFALYFMNVTNDYGTGTDTQALALNARGFRQGYYNCVLRSFQDTVRAYRGSQLFSRCTITGGVDFIFGRDSFAWFEQISIPILKGSKEVITASGRYVNDPNGFFVFNNATIYSDGAQPGSAYLGRPWREGAKVTFQNSYMSDVVNPAGWLAWKDTDPRTEFALFQEYGNWGPGAPLQNRMFTTLLDSPRLPVTILGFDYLDWIDYEYRPIVNLPQTLPVTFSKNEIFRTPRGSVTRDLTRF